MSAAAQRVASYARDVTALLGTPGVNELTYYPALQSLLSGLLRDRGLPFQVRVGTSQYRSGGGADMPDLALYDGAGEFPVVLGEVKLPSADLDEMALSTGTEDQVGRYLRRTGVVLLTNIRGFSLVVSGDPKGNDPVAPAHRRVLDTVELWPSASALKKGAAVSAENAEALGDLLERAVTEFAAISEPESLARILARQARRAKQDLPKQFSQAVRPLLDDFGKALGIHFEGEEGEEFLRSSLIQTVFYGLFASWTLWHRAGQTGSFAWQDLSRWLRIPFLGALFHEFEHPSRLKELGLKAHLDAAAATLARVDGERFFARFQAPQIGFRRRDEPVGGPAGAPSDSAASSAPAPPGAAEQGGGSAATTAILYFYEPFLEAFDPDLRKQLGVWYTPWEIVRYQVRRVDQLLREELDCPKGLADRRVVVLDPCCGTGAYLIETLRCVADQLRSEGAGALLPAELLDAVCRRLIGFEILTAPFVIAQLQLYLMLDELGAPPDESHRPAVFLTNALTGWEGADQMKLSFPELQEEHDAARRVKREEKIIVALGNPPYNRFAGVPLDEEASLVDHYKGIRRDDKGRQLGKSAIYERWGIRKQLLDDLYIRFFRLAEVRIGDRADHGIVSFISNSSFLAGRSHPLMRESLLTRFDDIWVDNLHGNRLASERTPQGDSCETIFNTDSGGPGIKVGTSITTFLKRGAPRAKTPSARVHVRDFWGRADAKRRALLASLDLESTSSKAREECATQPEGPRPYEDVTPTETGLWRLVSTTAFGSYEDWPALDDLFVESFQGVNPARGLEGGVVETDASVLERRMLDYFSDMPFDELAERHPVLCQPRARYEPKSLRKELLARATFRSGQILAYQVFPGDVRWIYYETEAKLLTERSPQLGDHLTHGPGSVPRWRLLRANGARAIIKHSIELNMKAHDPLYQQIARIGHALGSGPRLALLDLLGQGPRTVEALAKEAGLTLANASQHLKVLRQARLVEAEKRGVFVTYRVADDGVGDFWGALRGLAERRLAEVQQIARAFVARRGSLEPLDRQRLIERVRAGEVTLLDVRPAEEYQAAHIAGAVSVPLKDLESHLASLPTDREVVAYCRGPYCVLAPEAVTVLRARGYRASALGDGVAEWRAQGLPVASAGARIVGRRAGLLAGAALAMCLNSTPVQAAEGPSLDIGFRLQGWYMVDQLGAADGGTAHDFLLRRGYVALTGKLTTSVSAFAHVSGDRIGQAGLDTPGLGLGTGLALRDAWVAWQPSPAFRVQAGRMYVPFTRAFGTESTFALLTVDLPQAQGGGRGALFYPSKVGRDDGLVVWGVPWRGRLQYRLGVMEGVEGQANPGDSLRFAGRLSVNLLEAETAWFNRGTYLGEKRVLALGLGLDRQAGLALGGTERTYRAWTADAFLDHPIGRGALTIEASYTDAEGLPQGLAFAGLAVGADARTAYVQAGYLLPWTLGPGRIQVYGRTEHVLAEDTEDASLPSAGLSYFLRGHDLKLSADWSRSTRGTRPASNALTLQAQVAF